MKFRAITTAGEEYIERDESLVSFSLPKVWNEDEIRERLSGKSYFIERDYTVTKSPNNFEYVNAKIYLDPKDDSPEVRQILSAPYKKTQEEVIQEKLIPSWAKDIIARIEALENRK